MRENFESVLSNLSPDDMPTPDLRDIAAEFGVSIALKMVREFGGSVFYIPKIDSFKSQINNFILKNYNKHNARELANACHVSIRYIYKVVEASQDSSNLIQERLDI
jgi:Mor family transcriptional regulator